MERLRKKEAASEDTSKQKSIVFIHPDLGIGGAERLVIDAAVGLQNLSHKITIFTSHCEPTHCFDEARDGTLDVRVRGNWLFPPTILGRFKILFSILRQIHLILTITWSGELQKLKPVVFFLDQLSAGIPFLRWFWEDTHIIFYCHFPDLLLVQGRRRWYKRIWRIGFDWWEGWGIRGADRVVVNSGFTKGVVEDVWKGLGGERGVGVVYPCVDTKKSTMPNAETAGDLWRDKKVLLSINRFERKKDVGLAIKAFAGLKSKDRVGVRLVIAGTSLSTSSNFNEQPCILTQAGGYDTRVQENVNYHKELESLADSAKLKHATAKNLISALSIPENIEVLFLLSVPAQLKSSLLNAARLLVYTPSNEHFGIVPLEAMLSGVPVLAANSGGPLETILDPETGWLRSVDKVEEWTNVMQQVLHQDTNNHLQQMGENGKRRVKEEFSDTKMANRLDEEIETMVKAPRVQATELGDVALSIPILACCLFAIGAVFKAALTSSEIKKLELVLGTVIFCIASAGIVGVVYRLLQNESAFM
ncbi:Alpha-1,3-mannosyltransferase-like protein [Mycoblastus sanguinarius]|nr:Alpha-1,3-mannosyltransferase-like protein [Mycoblastus sanguinarius]